MPFFRCQIRGEGFPGSLIGEAGAVGFYATRFVKAADAGTAEKVVIGWLREEPTLLACAERPKQAKVWFEEIMEISVEEGMQARGGVGFTFYSLA